ncbi:MAG TPA: MogA/MoaB family molybdenum cofactor biosynthesis protein [Termitinemataceae bacterium]|nr:MogA/MoaB family molybdenum cofactor biosynthesis protein [Termitinemataceae bacterium]HOM22860.1 MogA/MoaB family molybdenum cofactor biosynthesis protein [Termitinemataceae bacterium]HPP99801.1 MogA/MoaB family molybdenum cofactor biosynthesis protein [Termitinemataceae bacterium]
MTIWVLTISDRASQGIYADRAGPAVMEELEQLLSPPPRFFYRCVPDGYDSVLTALTEAAGLTQRGSHWEAMSPGETINQPGAMFPPKAMHQPGTMDYTGAVNDSGAESISTAPPDWIITVGGTGIGPRDTTPEATRDFIEGEIPGLAEYLRQKSLEETVFAVFSRGIVGYRGTTLVANFPGSERAARFYARQLAPLMDHALRMRRGEGH